MQQDLNGLIRWTSQWQMKFNVDKCSVMHIGTRNIQYTYKMNGQVLQQVDAQSYLGVVIRRDLKASDQCAKAYAKASRVLGMIGRNIRYKSREVSVESVQVHGKTACRVLYSSMHGHHTTLKTNSS